MENKIIIFKVIKYFFAIFFILTQSCLSIQSKTYYIDSSNGNDSNLGLTPNQAWCTLDKLNRGRFNKGDTILLKSGCVWREELILPADGLNISSFGVGEKPKIIGSDILSGWENYGKNIWRIVISKAHGSVIISSDTGDVVWGNKKSEISELAKNYDYTSNANYLYIFKDSDINTTNERIELMVRDFGIISGWYKSPKNDINIDGVEICFTINANIRTVGSSNWVVKNSILHHSGSTDESDGQGIQIEGKNIKILNNKIYENGQHGIFVSSFGNSKIKNILIEGNEIYNNYHTGIDVMSDGGDSNSNSNIVISRNHIYDERLFEGNEIGIQLLAYNNAIIKNVTIHHNLIYNISGIGISVMNNSDSIHIHNNSILNSYSACINLDNDSLFCEVYNNVGVTDKYYAVFFVHNSKNKEIDHNVWFNNFSTQTKNTFINDTYYSNKKLYNMETNFDINGEFINPQYALAKERIFVLPSSKLIKKGKKIEYSYDFYGYRIQENISIGAIEFTGN